MGKQSILVPGISKSMDFKVQLLQCTVIFYKIINIIEQLMNKNLIKGISLTDYFKLREVDPFEDSADLASLVGDLITQPPVSASNSNSNIPIASKTQLQSQNRTRSTYKEKPPSFIPEQRDVIKTMGISKKNSLTYRDSQLQSQLQSKLETNNQLQGEYRFKKLSNMDFRSSSIKVYNSQKVRIRQVSNSPYLRELSKPRQSMIDIQSGSSKLMPATLKHPIGIDSLHQFQGGMQKFLQKGVSPIQKEQKIRVNLKSLKPAKELEKEDEAKKKKMEGVYSTVNAYTKKIREHQRAKYDL